MAARLWADDGTSCAAFLSHMHIRLDGLRRPDRLKSAPSDHMRGGGDFASSPQGMMGRPATSELMDRGVPSPTGPSTHGGTEASECWELPLVAGCGWDVHTARVGPMSKAMWAYVLERQSDSPSSVRYPGAEGPRRLDRRATALAHQDCLLRSSGPQVLSDPRAAVDQRAPRALILSYLQPHALHTLHIACGMATL
jgi:hypothetical protein